MPASLNDPYGNQFGSVMNYLLHQRARFQSEEEFNAFLLGELRQLGGDLRLFGLELSLRLNFSGQPVTYHSATRKLSQ